MNDYYYKACQGVDPSTMQPNGVWHFCCITTDKMNRQLIYPLGYCRANKHQKGAKPCVHNTPAEANACYRKYELDHDVKKYTGEDYLLPDGKEVKGRNVYAPCASCGEQCKSYAVVGTRELEYQLCTKHLNREELEKLYPQYEVIE